MLLCRGCTCVEQSVLGGAAHLLNFDGTDTLSAAYYVQVGVICLTGVGVCARVRVHCMLAWGPRQQVSLPCFRWCWSCWHGVACAWSVSTSSHPSPFRLQFALNGGRPVGQSIPATEHSVMTAWPSGELAHQGMA